MIADDFRRLALAIPGAVESKHNKHPDFRVGGKIFATLGYPDSQWAMVKLRPEQQNAMIAVASEIFSPATGAWGKRGSTLMRLERADERAARSAIEMAWGNLHGRTSQSREGAISPRVRKATPSNVQRSAQC